MEDFFNMIIDKLLANSYEIDGMRFITPKKAYPLLKEGLLLIDLRPLSESTFKQAKVERLLLLPYTDFPDRIADIPTDHPILIGDAVGIQTKNIYKELIKMGYRNVFALAGGFVDWERDGLPMEENVNQRLSGACVCQLKPRE